MIEAGSICVSIVPYYNSSTGKNDFKKRPVLVLGAADSGDYNVLPISRVTNSRNLDLTYDIQIDPSTYPSLKLTAISYVRIHKQTVVNKASLNEISNMKKDYPDFFIQILDKLNEYNNYLIENAKL